MDGWWMNGFRKLFRTTPKGPAGGILFGSQKAFATRAAFIWKEGDEEGSILEWVTTIWEASE